MSVRRASLSFLIAVLLFFPLLMPTARAYENPIPFYTRSVLEAAMGDPFVMKYNGVYYCYVSGGNCFSSLNMVDWTYEGNVFTGAHARNLYAPEVFHWNGAFYCIACPNGETNYLFKSNSPTGPFTVQGDALGGDIDGSIFRDDNGSLWFTHAAWNGISLYAISSPDAKPVAFTTLPVSMSGMWTEGPGIFKRNGIYYMTYTGNHVLDDAYRVCYAASSRLTGGWTMPEQNILLLSTGGETKALGHSSTVIGPDLDTYYIVYHNRYPDGTHMIDRGFNMQAIRWNGEKPLVCVYTGKQEDPALPDWTFRPEEATAVLDKRFLSDQTSGDIFTAEINLIPARSDALFAWRDEQNFCRVSFTEDEVILTAVRSGMASEQRAALPRKTDVNVLQCLRIQQTAEELCLYLEGSLMLESTPVGGGQIGCSGGTVGYMAFSDKALGNLDYLAEKFPCTPWDAALANNQDVLTHVPSREAGDAILLKAGEAAVFDLTVENPLTVTLSLRGCAPEGADVRILINDIPAAQAELPASDTYLTQAFRSLTLEAGAARIAVEVIGGSFEMAALATAEETPVAAYLNDFEETTRGMLIQEGASRRTEGKLRLSAQQSPKGDCFGRTVLGEQGWGDYAAQVSFFLEDGGEHSEAGVYLRSANDSNTQASSFRFRRRWYQQCYFVGVTKGRITLYKQNYNETVLASYQTDTDFSQPNTLRVEALGEVLTVYLNGECIIRYADDQHPFLNGRFGFKAVDGVTFYDDLMIEPLLPSEEETTSVLFPQ